MVKNYGDHHEQPKYESDLKKVQQLGEFIQSMNRKMIVYRLSIYNKAENTKTLTEVSQANPYNLPSNQHENSGKKKKLETKKLTD